ncbi:WD40/YVTN/BNR-like repeat-containing protein [Gemmatimonadota bacterium]
MSDRASLRCGARGVLLFSGVLTLFLLPASLWAQASVPEEFLENLRWQNVGPDRGGRSIGVAGSDARPLEYFFGATGGGLWKTTDGGTNWRAVTDGKIASSSVGAVAVCEADPDVVYIGTGETQLRGNVMQGDGVYKSTDGGTNWSHLGLAATQNISRIRVHPTDCNTAWVGAFGVHSMPNPERGVYKTTDGGESWTRVLFRDDRSGAVDISVHPSNPNIVFAALWEAWRKSWGMSSGGPGSGLFRSTDGGESWEEITRNPGLPQEGLIGKIGVAVSPVDAQRVYAIMENDEGGVFRSDDGGGELDPHQRRAKAPPTGLLLHPDLCGSAGKGPSLCPEYRLLSIGGCRRRVRSNPGGSPWG